MEIRDLAHCYCLFEQLLFSGILIGKINHAHFLPLQPSESFIKLIIVLYLDLPRIHIFHRIIRDKSSLNIKELPLRNVLNFRKFNLDLSICIHIVLSQITLLPVNLQQQVVISWIQHLIYLDIPIIFEIPFSEDKLLSFLLAQHVPHK